MGTVSGMSLGIFSGVVLVSAIARNSGAAISMGLRPVVLVTILVLGVLLGLVAALIPAHRSTRLIDAGPST